MKLKTVGLVLELSFLGILQQTYVAHAAYTYTTIDDPLGEAYGNRAFDINDLNQIVGSYEDSNGQYHGFIYQNGAYTTIDDPLDVGGLGTEINSINDSEQLVGSYFDRSGNPHGFFYNGSTYTSVNDPLGTGAIGTVPFAINGLGQYVGYYTDKNHIDHGFFYNGSTYVSINDPLGVGSISPPFGTGKLGTAALGINDEGELVGTYADANNKLHGFLYNDGTYTTIDDPLGVNGSSLFEINNSGELVGDYIDSQGKIHGFVYDNSSFVTVSNSLAGGSLGSIATGISNTGVVVGFYTDSSNISHAFIGTPVPEPKNFLGVITSLTLVGTTSNILKKRNRQLRNKTKLFKTIV